MDLEIGEFKIRPCKMSIATMLVKYHELIMKCDLVWYPQAKHYWIRMPERWFTRDKKTSYCYWPTREISDEFQKEMLQKIFDSGMLSESEISDIHAFGAEKNSKKRNA